MTVVLMIPRCSAKRPSILFIQSMTNTMIPDLQHVQLPGQIDCDSPFPAIFQAGAKLEQDMDPVAVWFRTHRQAILDLLAQRAPCCCRACQFTLIRILIW